MEFRITESVNNTALNYQRLMTGLEAVSLQI